MAHDCQDEQATVDAAQTEKDQKQANNDQTELELCAACAVLLAAEIELTNCETH